MLVIHTVEEANMARRYGKAAGKSVESAMRRLAQVLTILDRPAYRGQALAAELRDQIRSHPVVPSRPTAAGPAAPGEEGNQVL